MPSNQKLLPIYIFQIVPLLIYPPETLKSGAVVIAIVAVVFAFLGYGLWRGRSWALSLSLTLQGFNVIVRLMMLFPNAVVNSGGESAFNVPFIALSVLSIALSLFFLTRLDRPDVRATIVA
ncbi:MAG: DUF2127 domain-containing protein [Chloroflexi bacterium]|nr:DUF2127 domain-containing protein [Chloroflexota bacterium]MCA2000458.1 DUF2127 domain-containing protein [Chloroflexota bacterium]